MKAASIIALILLAGLGGCVYTSCRPVWQFDHLEQNARKVITGPQLQAWASNLLAQYPMETNFSASELGTDFPQQLRGLAPRVGPSVYVHVYDDTNQPSYVQIMWGSGFLGHAGFYVGATNFALSGSAEHAWQPGVYFYRQN